MSEQPKCTLSNAELLAAVGTWVSKQCDTGGRAWTLSVPVNFNRDPDMLITELRKRYADLLARHNALVEAVAWERECCQDIRPLVAWADLYVRHGEDYVDAVADDLCTIQDYARAEADRLIAEGHAE